MSRHHLFAMLSVFVFVATSNELRTQSSDDLNASLKISMKGIAKRYNDSVVVRWAPGNAALWRISRNQGYRIERAEVVEGTVGSYTTLTTEPILQWTEQQWTTFLQSYQYADSTEEQLIAVASSLAEQAGASTDATSADLADLGAVRENKNRLEMAFSFALLVAERSRVAANALAMRYVDRTAALGIIYKYRISMLGSTSPYTVAPALADADARPRSAEKRDAGITALALDTRVVLAWANSTGHSTYDVYRSRDGKNFKKLNETPLLTIRQGTADGNSNGFVDSGLVNYTMYTYRVTGNTSFAEVEEIGTASAMPVDMTAPPTPSGVHTEHVGVKNVEVTWDMPNESMPDLIGFYVQRARSEEGPYSLVNTKPLAADVRKYLDTSAILGDTLYYQVVAVDTAKNGSISFAVYVAFADSIAPTPAVLVRGTMDTAGVVRIIVRHPKERDVMGYRLLFANDSTHEFSVKQELFNEDSVFAREDTVLVDTAEVRTLTKYVYYRVIALDYHFNESEPSNIIAIPRPDVIPPVAPVITDYVASDTSVTLFYNPSTSRDVSHHVIQRRAYDATQSPSVVWDSLARAGIRDSVIMDRTGALSAMYQYAIVAFDSAGNQSPPSNIVTLKRYDNGMRPTVTSLRATYDSTAKTVRLQWEYRDIGEPHSFMIYKRTDGAMESYAIVKDQRQRDFVDIKGASRASTYAIKVVCAGGSESILSQAISPGK
ncbi:MAG: hypothetical protein NTX15_00340 [Candidatus Kapabacteria bacterium]|nr:hypothetical protein [Candidatus Kapabacteria bacterium]